MKVRFNAAQSTLRDHFADIETVPLHELRCEFTAGVRIAEPRKNGIPMRDINPVRTAVPRVPNIKLPPH